MKVCNKCKQEKSFDEFYKNSKRKDGHQDYCKSCKSNFDKKQWSKHSDKWKDHYALKNKENREWLTELKSKSSCAKCGDSRHYVLDYHHIDPKTKSLEVSNAVNYSRSKILTEIEKCIPLCSNCHREFHHLERTENITIEEYALIAQLVRANHS